MKLFNKTCKSVALVILLEFSTQLIFFWKPFLSCIKWNKIVLTICENNKLIIERNNLKNNFTVPINKIRLTNQHYKTRKYENQYLFKNKNK